MICQNNSPFSNLCAHTQVPFCIRRPVIGPGRPENCYDIFLSKDFTVGIASISVKLLGEVPYNTLEGKLFFHYYFHLISKCIHDLN